MARQPGAPALSWGQTSWDYATLAGRAGAVAQVLRQRGIGRDDRVGFASSRGCDMLAGLLGTLAAGATYVALNPAQSERRLRSMVADAGCALVFCEQLSSTHLGPRLAPIPESEHPLVAAAPGKIASIVYTRGSSDDLKGVPVRQAGVLARLDSTREPGSEGRGRVSAEVAACFDSSVFKLFAPLTCGGEVRLVRASGELEIEPPESFALLPGPRPGPGLADAYPMSKLQLGVMFHAEPGGRLRTTKELTIAAKRLRAPFDGAAFRSAWRQCVDRHQALRTSFALAEGTEPVQRVHLGPDGVPDWAEDPFRAKVTRIGGLRDKVSRSKVAQLRVSRSKKTQSESTRVETTHIEAHCEELLRRELDTPFDIRRPPLARARLVELGGGQILVVIAAHRAVLDERSLELLQHELLDRYRAELAGQPRAVSPLRCGPVDFVMRERVGLVPSLAPWRGRLAGARPLPLGEPRRPRVEKGQSCRRMRVTPWLHAGLQRRAEALGVELEHILLAVHARVLGRWTATADVLTGLRVQGGPERRDAGLVLGSFTHALPVRLRVDGCRWSALIHAAAEEARRVHQDRHLPPWALQRELGASAAVSSTFAYLALDAPPPDFELLDTRRLRGGAELMLGVDFVLEGERLTLHHRQPSSHSDDADAVALFALTITELEAAIDLADRPLMRIAAGRGRAWPRPQHSRGPRKSRGPQGAEGASAPASSAGPGG